MKKSSLVMMIVGLGLFCGRGRLPDYRLLG